LLITTLTELDGTVGTLSSTFSLVHTTQNINH